MCFQEGGLIFYMYLEHTIIYKRGFLLQRGLKIFLQTQGGGQLFLRRPTGGQQFLPGGGGAGK